jgi:hypothetical protein
MRMAVVTDSVNIAGVGYSRSQSVLRVRFRDGSEYELEGVGEARYVALMAAPSIGEYFAAHVKGHYTTWRVTGPRARARTS